MASYRGYGSDEDEDEGVNERQDRGADLAAREGAMQEEGD